MKWRIPLKTCRKILGKITLAIAAAITVVLFLQHTIGRTLFWWECRTDEGVWEKPLEPADSLAYDLTITSGVAGIKGCGGQSLPCVYGLIARKDRSKFVEIFVYEPDPTYLSTETGWYRYWLAPAHDPACALFYASKGAQENWLGAFSDPYMIPHTAPPLLADPDAVCIASKKIEKPKSRYLYQERNDIEKRIFGLSIWRHDLIDQQTGEIRVHFQRSSYLGPWLYEAYAWLSERLNSLAGSTSCSIPDERYKRKGDTFPQSTLGSMSDEWPLSGAVDPAELP